MAKKKIQYCIDLKPIKFNVAPWVLVLLSMWDSDLPVANHGPCSEMEGSAKKETTLGDALKQFRKWKKT